MSNELDEFGELFIREVRDRAIRNFKAILDGTLKPQSAQALHKRLAALGDRETLEEFGVDIVNHVVFEALFFFVEHEEYRLIAPSGRNLAELSDELLGELHGEIFGEEGWIARFTEDKRGM